MADKKLNEVKKVTDMAYVSVIMADGSIGQIAKADLASVVAGLVSGRLSSNGLSLYTSDNIADADKIHETYSLKAGQYCFRVGYNITNNIPVNTNGILIHTQRADSTNITSTNIVRQEYFSHSGSYLRYGRGDGTTIVFGEWKSIATQSI